MSRIASITQLLRDFIPSNGTKDMLKFTKSKQANSRKELFKWTMKFHYTQDLLPSKMVKSI